MTAAVIASCAERYGVLADQIMGRSRRRAPARARQAAMYVLVRRDKMSSTAVGRIMGRDHSTVLHGVALVERKRSEEPGLDALVSMLMALPRYHHEVERVPASVEVQLDLLAPRTPMVSIPVRRRPNPHPAICTVQRKAKNDLSPDDSDAIRRMRGTNKLLSALAQAGYV